MMNLDAFRTRFEASFPPARRDHPTRRYSLRLKIKIKQWYLNHYVFDSLRDVDGMISVKKQRLLNLAYAHLEPREAYLEIGTWQGKSLIAAMRGNAPRSTFACDNFSEYDASKGKRLELNALLMRNLRQYQLDRHVTFYDAPFQRICTTEKLPTPIGLYFYDAAHDEQSQYQGITLVESFLADTAVVIIDDWRFAPDSQSYAKVGTERAIRESQHAWEPLYELPARFNGDRAMWWNGVAVFAFRRKHQRVTEDVKLA